MALTITEALAEVKTTAKRIAKKREFVAQFLMRQDQFKDPLASDGGSALAIKRERQAIADLEMRVIRIRQAIQAANASTPIVVNGASRTVAEWLTWRREIAPDAQKFLASLRQGINNTRTNAQKQGLAVVGEGQAAQKPGDVVVNVNEQELAKEIEDMEQTLGVLDGLLSLKNATVLIEV